MFGRRPSAVGTLVERTSRHLLLPVHGDNNAPRVPEALAAAVARLPQHLRRLLAWDHGKETAEHVRFAVDTGVQIYLCNPRSPWRRDTNESTNALLRQYLPHLPQRSGCSGLGQAELDTIAAELNGPPRETRAWRAHGALARAGPYGGSI